MRVKKPSSFSNMHRICCIESASFVSCNWKRGCILSWQNFRRGVTVNALLCIKTYLTAGKSSRPETPHKPAPSIKIWWKQTVLVRSYFPKWNTVTAYHFPHTFLISHWQRLQGYPKDYWNVIRFQNSTPLQRDEFAPCKNKFRKLVMVDGIGARKISSYDNNWTCSGMVKKRH